MANCLNGECSDDVGNCSPCKDCNDCPDPVLPRCNEALTPDGVFTNATVTIENGCIVKVNGGEPFVYDPDTCCAEPGTGGGGGQGLDGPPGPPGQNATIRIGAVNTVGPNQRAEIVNVGTDVAAILDFYIPQGKAGADAEDGRGVTDARGGWNIENGLIKGLPPTWPPLAAFVAVSESAGFDLVGETNDNGVIKLTLDASVYDTSIKNYIASEIEKAVTPLQQAITQLQSQITAQAEQISSLSQRVSRLEAGGTP